MKKLVLAVIFLIYSISGAQTNIFEDKWISTGDFPLASTSAYSIVIAGDQLYVGGYFDAIRNVFADNFAKFDIKSEQWEGFSGYEETKISFLYKDLHDNIYAVNTNYEESSVKKWNSSSWTKVPFNATFDSERRIYSVAADSSGILYIGSSFLEGVVTGLTKCTEDSCTPVANWIGFVKIVAVDRKDNLYFLGKNSEKFGIFKWGNITTTQIKTDFDNEDSYQFDLMTFDSSNALYIAGSFKSAEKGINRIAKWTGKTWNNLGGGISCTENCFITSTVFDKNNNLYVAGEFNKAGNTEVRNIAKWDGKQWSDVGGGTNGRIYSLAIDSEDNIYVLGTFYEADGNEIKYLAKWDGVNWRKVGEYREGFPAVAEKVVSSNNTLFACGFRNGLRNILKYEKGKWILIKNEDYDDHKLLGVDSKKNLYVRFAKMISGSLQNYRVGKWDGSAWSYIGEELSHDTGSLGIDKNDNIYLSTMFSEEEESKIGHVVKWNGKEWIPMGDSLTQNATSIAIDKSGQIYVAGKTRVFRWTGIGWTSLGKEFDYNSSVFFPFIKTIAVDNNGILYAGGFFNLYDSNSINNIAKWTGEEWVSVGAGLKCPYNTYTCVNEIKFDSLNHLYAVGDYFVSKGKDLLGIAKWDGKEWLPVKQGTTGQVNSITIDSGNNIFIGGYFSGAGNKVSPYVVKYTTASINFQDGDTDKEDSDITEEIDIDDDDSESAIPDTETTKKDKSGCTLLFL